MAFYWILLAYENKIVNENDSYLFDYAQAWIGQAIRIKYIRRMLATGWIVGGFPHHEPDALR